MLDYWYPLSMASGIIYYNESHPLHMQCLKTFLRCKTKVRGTSDSIHLTMGHTPMPISTDIVSQIAHKMPDLWYPLDTSTVNEVMYRTQRQPLLVKCFKTFHGCTSQVGGASESIYKPPMGHTMPFLLTLTL